MGNCVRLNIWYFIKGKVNETKRLVESFHIYTDEQFISFLEINVTNLNGHKNLGGINDPINLYEDTILHYAVFHKRTKLIKYLLKNGANPYKTNKRKKTPMDIAKKNGLDELVNKFT